MVIILAARLVGGTRPVSPLAAVFSDPDGTPCETPCLFGIRPGETSAEQTVLLLGQHTITRDGVWIADNVLHLPDAGSYVTFRVRLDGLIESIVLMATLEDSGVAPKPGSLLDSITLGDYMAVFDVEEVGVPLSPYVVFSYPVGGTFATIARPDDITQQINVRTPLAHLFVSIPIPCPSRMDYGAGGPWHGFTTVEYYRSQLNLTHGFPSRMPIPPQRTCYMPDNEE